LSGQDDFSIPGDDDRCGHEQRGASCVAEGSNRKKRMAVKARKDMCFEGLFGQMWKRSSCLMRAFNILSIRQGDNERLLGRPFIETCRITQDVMSSCAGVKNCWFLCLLWWGTSERFNDFVVYFVNHCVLTRPDTSDLVRLSDLTPTHVVATGGVFLMAHGAASASCGSR
jgi:hypothetical protein